MTDRHSARTPSGSVPQLFLGLALSCAMGCGDGSPPPSHPSRCAHPFEHRPWGVSLCLDEPYQFHPDADPDRAWLALAPRPDWPFLHGYLFRFRVAPLNTTWREYVDARREASTRATPNVIAEAITDFRTFRAGEHEGISFRALTPGAQCAAVHFVLHRDGRLHELTYPACVGPDDHAYFERADAQAIAILETLRWR